MIQCTHFDFMELNLQEAFPCQARSYPLVSNGAVVFKLRLPRVFASSVQRYTDNNTKSLMFFSG